MTQNRLYFGMVEDCTREKIEEFLKGDKTSKFAFFRWPFPFEKFNLDDFAKSSVRMPLISTAGEKKSKGKKSVEAEVFEANDIQQLLAESNKQRFIVIENIHILAHGEENPEIFYKKFLSACNYYTQQWGISFILSCARIPAVFVNENPFIHQLVFEKCEWDFDEVERESQTVRFEKLHEIYGQLRKHHYYKINGILNDGEGRKLNDTEFRNLPKDEKYRAIDRQINGIIDSSMEFESQLYVQEEEQQKKETSLEDIAHIKNQLKECIFGQDEAIQRVVDVALMFYGARKTDDKPRQNFLFVGPSGVGKTELCGQLAKNLPGYKFLQINLAEHQDEYAVDKLLGVGRGFKDSEAGGILTEPVRRYPKHIILFDELDHAHQSVLRLFYKIFEGDIQDGRGRKISFRDCFIFMTTNKGTISEDEDIPPEERRRAIEEELIEEGNRTEGEKNRLTFNEAFLGRINWIVQFNTLKPTDLLRIAKKYFEDRIINFYREDPWKVKICLEPLVKQKPKLLEAGILSKELLFYEIWALMAYQPRLREQGARRLYQYMDELLIYPLEQFRVRNQKQFFKENHTIKIKFPPYLPAIGSYDRASLLLIDDEEDAATQLRERLKDYPIDVKWSKFDDSDKMTEATSATIILLDIMEEGKEVGKGELKRLQENKITAPISAYTSMGEGANLDKLKSELWKFKISQYINKKGDEEQIKQSIFKDIRDAYLMQKSRNGKQIITAALRPPFTEVKEGDQKVDFTLSYTVEK